LHWIKQSAENIIIIDCILPIGGLPLKSLLLGKRCIKRNNLLLKNKENPSKKKNDPLTMAPLEKIFLHPNHNFQGIQVKKDKMELF
jgi:hypothetical protein